MTLSLLPKLRNVWSLLGSSPKNHPKIVHMIFQIQVVWLRLKKLKSLDLDRKNLNVSMNDEWLALSLLYFWWTKEKKTEMVFCYQNCFDLLWERNVLVIEKTLLKCEAEGREFSKFLRSLEQFIQKVKGRNNFRWQNTVWPQPILKKVRSWWQIPPQHQST